MPPFTREPGQWIKVVELDADCGGRKIPGPRYRDTRQDCAYSLTEKVSKRKNSLVAANPTPRRRREKKGGGGVIPSHRGG